MHFINQPNRVSHVKNVSRKETDPIIQNGLALTPARMLDLTHQGFSVSAQNSRMLAEVRSDSLNRMDVPLEFTRGFDIAVGYQAQQSVRKKIVTATETIYNGKE